MTVTVTTTKGQEKTRLVITVEEAGELLGIGRGAAYEAAKRGDLPTIRIGKLLRVPIKAFERMLEATN